ncbi:hypothetical protein L596_017797 [Steinernema carpocapsae]|uniref:Uncharacterized protein n=1 Tax=Steinernema carpocapsae TaxID=34508 RepID=A0A4U5N308_STECR|nr:hypothetical protein L596_017797 [Steinernema carpocapsae]
MCKLKVPSLTNLARKNTRFHIKTLYDLGRVDGRRAHFPEGQPEHFCPKRPKITFSRSLNKMDSLLPVQSQVNCGRCQRDIDDGNHVDCSSGPMRIRKEFRSEIPHESAEGGRREEDDGHDADAPLASDGALAEGDLLAFAEKDVGGDEVDEEGAGEAGGGEDEVEDVDGHRPGPGEVVFPGEGGVVDHEGRVGRKADAEVDGAHQPADRDKCLKRGALVLGLKPQALATNDAS